VDDVAGQVVFVVWRGEEAGGGCGAECRVRELKNNNNENPNKIKLIIRFGIRLGLVNGWVLSDVEDGWFGVYSDRVVAVKRTRSVLGTGRVGAGINWKIPRWVLMLVNGGSLDLVWGSEVRLG
jgi:hypothetical protein